MADSPSYGFPSGPHTPSEEVNLALSSPPGLTRRPRAGTMPSTLHLGPSLSRPESLTRRLSGMPASSNSHHGSLPASGDTTPAEVPLHHGHPHGPRPSASSSDLASAVFRAKPVSRLRSGSLVNLPSPGAGTGAFGGGMFAGAWTPRASNMSSQILEEIRSNESSVYGEEVRTLDYLGLDDASSPRSGHHDISVVEALLAKQASSGSLHAHAAASPARHRSNTVAGIPMPRREPLSRRHSPFAMAGDQPVAEEDEDDEGAIAAYADKAQLKYMATEGNSADTGYYPSAALEGSTVDALSGGMGMASARPRASTIGILDDASPGAYRRRAPSSAAATGPTTPGEYSYATPSGVVRAAEEARILNGAFERAGATAFDPSRVSTPERVRERNHEPSPPPQQPTRSLWIGNIDPKTTTSDLYTIFGAYAPIETLRILPDKECAFVNFYSVEDCIRAKADVASRLGAAFLPRHSGAVRLGFGKPESVPSVPSTPANAFNAYRAAALASAQNSGDLQSSPTRALWVGSIPAATTERDLMRIFSPYGSIESVRVLTHKNCGFINFERTDDAIAAKKSLNGKEILGSEVGAVKIGFAKVPVKGGTPSTPGRAIVDPTYTSGSAIAAQLAAMRGSVGRSDIMGSPIDAYRASMLSNAMSPSVAYGYNFSPMSTFSPSAAGQALQAATGTPTGTHATALAMDLAMAQANISSVPLPPAAEVQSLMKDLSGDDAEAEQDAIFASEPRPPINYVLSVGTPEDHPAGRLHNNDVSRTRDIKKRLEGGVTQPEADALAVELLDDSAALSSDYIGNVIIQRLFERCSDPIKIALLERIAPHLPIIGGHKNGTWAAQKIIECASTPTEIALICASLKRYTPALLLGGFSNYVVQGVLKFGSPASDFVFDCMVDRCWEIGQGRFGARSMRTCLDHASTKRVHIKRVALAIILNSIPLSTNPNGTLLLTWVLDTSGMPGRFRLLAPKLAPHLSHLCTHKLASGTVLRVVNQKVDPEASNVLIKALFDTSSQVLEDVLADQAYGVTVIQKIISSPTFDAAEKQRLGTKARTALINLRLQSIPAYRKLVDDLTSIGLPVAGVESSPTQTPGVGTPSQPQPQTSLRPAFAFASTPANSPAGLHGARPDPATWQQGQNTPSAINAQLLAQMSALHMSPQRNASPLRNVQNGSPAYNGPGTPISLAAHAAHLNFTPGPGSPAGMEMYGGMPVDGYSPYRGNLMQMAARTTVPYAYWQG